MNDKCLNCESESVGQLPVDGIDSTFPFCAECGVAQAKRLLTDLQLDISRFFIGTPEAREADDKHMDICGWCKQYYAKPEEETDNGQ